MVYQFLDKWQVLVGAAMGAAAPFLLWWFSQIYQIRGSIRERLYFIERLLVDQINQVFQSEITVNDFVGRLNNTIQKLDVDESDAYSIDWLFFPLFSVRSISADIHNIGTGSGYLDNKIAKSFSMSQDMPLFFEDIQRQFTYCLQTNKDMVFGKMNSARAQRQLFRGNINDFRDVLLDNLIKKNIPIYLKTLAQTRVALNEFRKIGVIRWRLRFDPKYRLFLKKSNYLEAKNSTFEKIEKFFEKDVEESIRSMRALI